jgi:spermidine synthase
MNLWWTEEYNEVQAALSFKTKDVLYQGKSKYQQIDVIDTYGFGKVMLIDGKVMVTEKDEFVYHEMIAHVPINVHPNPQRVLVVGAGDGGTLREILKHSEVKELDLVEIDKTVADVSKKFFPKLAVGYDDSRVSCHWVDGVEYIKSCDKTYDLIIIDSTDPFGPGEGLFTTEFYQNTYNLLSNNGILVNQSESPQWETNYVKGIYKKLHTIFPIFTMYQAFIPTYPSGHWLFSFASKTLDPIEDQKPNRWLEKKIDTKYYNPEVHKAAFALPNFIKKMFEESLTE